MSEENNLQAVVVADRETGGAADGHWTAPEISVLIIIGAVLAIAVAAIWKLISGKGVPRF